MRLVQRQPSFRRDSCWLGRTSSPCMRAPLPTTTSTTCSGSTWWKPWDAGPSRKRPQRSVERPCFWTMRGTMRLFCRKRMRPTPCFLGCRWSFRPFGCVLGWECGEIKAKNDSRQALVARSKSARPSLTPNWRNEGSDGRNTGRNAGDGAKAASTTERFAEHHVLEAYRRSARASLTPALVASKLAEALLLSLTASSCPSRLL